jgi:hypothetical protein
MLTRVKATKRCPRCGETKPIGDFLRPRAGTPSDYCHPCRREKRRLEYQRAGGSAVPYAQVLRRYGLTLDAYQALFEAQDGLCAACFRPETVAGSGGKPRRLGVDFDQESGRVRGLLCARCALLVAMVADHEALSAVAAYLERGTDGT